MKKGIFIWLQAARLRTLPLSVSGIIMGAFIARWRLVQEGGFSGPVGTDDRNELSLRNGQAHAAQRRVLDGRAGVEGDVQILGVEHASVPPV